MLENIYMVTMKKIAELCGVSRGTAPRTNGRGRANAETAAMIKKMAEHWL